MSTKSLGMMGIPQVLPKGWDIRISPRFWSYRPHFEFEIETSKYVLKTAKTMDELLAVFDLRHRIFLADTDAAIESDGFDLDQFDDSCDHIIIIDQETKRVVGTYRILCSEFHDYFYSETEFNLDKFLATPGTKIELGRACIESDHRNGNVIDLLWKGIAKYIDLTDAAYLFGCSSVKTVCAEDAKLLSDYLTENDKLSDDFKIRPIGKFEANIHKVKVSDVDPERSKSLLPPLLRSYFTAGAKVYGEPALDKEFECFDFLTILKIDEMSKGFRRRYFGR